MKQFSYDQITVKHIVLEAQISRKTFYRNFDSKEDVLTFCISTLLKDYTDQLQDLGKYSFSQLLNIIFPFCKSNKEFLLLLRDNNLLPLLLTILNKHILTEHDKLKKNSSLSGKYAPYIIYFNVGGIWNVMVKWLENDMHDSEEIIKNMLAQYLSNIHELDMRML